MNLAERVAIVTGAASGIGRAVAKGLSDAGAAGVVIADLDEKGANETLALIESRPEAKGLVVKTDVSDESQVAQMVAATLNRFSRIDILVNNAGICPVVQWEDTDVASWRKILDINLTSMFLCTKAVIPYMRAQRYGRIVFISSIGALVGSLVAHVGYGVSKAGVIALMKSVAKGFAQEGILANAICPGSIDTPLSDSLGEETKRRFVDACLLKRQGTPEEVADAVVFLVSERSTYITGITLNVDAGILMA
jgi:3-oxoacyl-[acyl-carrier protein] reductase